MTRRIYFREIYFYLVCLAAIIIFIVGIVMAYDGTINYVRPTTYMTRSSLAPMYQDMGRDFSDEEINEMVDEEIKAALENEKDTAFKNLLRGALLVFIAIILFVFHWRKAQQLWHISQADLD